MLEFHPGEEVLIRYQYKGTVVGYIFWDSVLGYQYYVAYEDGTLCTMWPGEMKRV